MRRRKFATRLVKYGVCAVLLLVALDAVLEAVARTGGALTDPVEVRSPAALFARLDYLRRFDGFKVVVLGDSIVHGRSLEEHGDAEWRRHGLTALLEERLRREMPGRDVLVMNLGLNGVLPGDLERLAALLAPCAVDLLVFDVGLRSFSEDFAAEDARLSRPWLATMTVGPDGRFRTVPAGGSLSARLENVADDFLVNHWKCYRMRDLLQARFLDGEPRQYTHSVWQKAGHGFRSAPPTAGENDLLMLVMRAAGRYQNINLRPDNPQRRALERLLADLTARRQKTLVFYAKENPELRDNLLDGPRYRQLYRELADVLGPYTGRDLVFLPPVDDLAAPHYLDHIHLNRDGYSILTERMWPPLVRLAAD